MPNFLKINRLAEVMKALMRDFFGPWNYGKVVKKKLEIIRKKKFEFQKVAMAGGKKPTLTI